MEGNFDAGKRMFIEFVGEVEKIIKERGVKTDRAAVSVLKEVNQKWNALCELYKSEYKQDVLKRNAIWNYFYEKMPEIRQFQK